MKNIIMIVLAGLVMQSCKTEEATPALASITVVNAAIDVASAKAYASDKRINWSAIPTGDVVNFANFKHFGVFTGRKNVNAVVSADTTKTLYSSTTDFKEAGLNTLFLCGQAGGYEGVYWLMKTSHIMLQRLWASGLLTSLQIVHLLVST